MRYINILVSMVLLAVLAACSSGGGDPGTNTCCSGTSNPGTTTSTVADFIFLLDKTSITNTGTDKAVLTVTALNASRNVVVGAPVSVSVDANAVFTATSPLTDASGKFSGDIAIGGDKSNRTINATITVNGVAKVAAVIVTGSKLIVSTIPATPAPGSAVTLGAFASDSSGTGIPNATVTFSGTAGASGSAVTNATGNATATFAAPATSGAYSLVVSGLGVSTTQSIQVVVPGASTIPPATGPVVSSSLSPDPTSILPNAAGSDTNRSLLSAKFLTGGNAGIPNMRVRFEIAAPALGSGESISTGTGAVYTNAAGVAQAFYIAGTRSSPTNGVTLRACYKATDFSSPTDCPDSVTSNLTVGGSALSIGIGVDNKMAKGLGGIAYVKQALITVNDAAGVAVKDAIVSVSVDITHYGKGTFGAAYPGAPNPPTISQGSLPDNNTAPTTVTNVWCANEDVNRNGFLETGEDTNNDGVIQPKKAEVTVAYVSGNKTDVKGQMLVEVFYPQNMGSWLSYTLRATTSVAGSEGDASRSFITGVLEEDLANGSFLTPPYGTGACNVAN